MVSSLSGGQPSIDLRMKLIKFAKNFNCNLRVVYTTCKVSQYFSLKDKTPKDLKAKILNTGISDLEIKILESLQIKDLKPKLNNQLTHKGACYFLDVFT